MDDIKRKNTIHKKTVEKIGADAVEIISPSASGGDCLPVDHGTMINNAVYEFIQYEVGDGAQSLKDINQLQFKALCMYIGKKVNKPIVLSDYVVGSGRPYNTDTLYALFPVWAYFAACGGFVPFVDDFLAFCGLSFDYIYSRSNNLNPVRLEFTQKIKDFQQMALSARLVEGRGNPTGILAILNHFHGWTSSASDRDEKTIQAASVASLPDLSADIVQIDQ